MVYLSDVCFACVCVLVFVCVCVKERGREREREREKHGTHAVRNSLCASHHPATLHIRCSG